MVENSAKEKEKILKRKCSKGSLTETKKIRRLKFSIGNENSFIKDVLDI